MAAPASLLMDDDGIPHTLATFCSTKCFDVACAADGRQGDLSIRCQPGPGNGRFDPCFAGSDASGPGGADWMLPAICAASDSLTTDLMVSARDTERTGFLA